MNKIIGILGGGQLAKMSLLASARLGFETAIMEKNADSPAGKLTKREYVGWVDNEEVFAKFINECDVFTLENEFIHPSYLRQIEQSGKKVFPSAETLEFIQDKYIQKTTFAGADLPIADFCVVSSGEDYKTIAAKLGNRFLLKSRVMGYDGYGNALVEDEASYISGIKNLSSRNSILYAEAFVPFVRELAVMVVRTKVETVFYPVVESIQENHICKVVKAPAPVEPELSDKIYTMLRTALEAITGYGIFGFELFQLADGSVLINEVAPRPHNSGHYSIEACETSQFENHIRAVLDLPLGSTKMRNKYAVMVNLLGKRDGPGFPNNYPEAVSEKRVALHIYGKAESRKGRKMGHITMTGDSTDIFETAEKIAKEIDL